MKLDANPISVIGQTQDAFRRAGIVPSGTFTGARLSCDVLAGGSDWQTVWNDDSMKPDIRPLLKTDDDMTIAMSYTRCGTVLPN